MKIFVSGATGHVGSHLVHRLAGEGLQVQALVRNTHKASKLLPESVKLFEGDIRNADDVLRAMEGCGQVYHLAAYAKSWIPCPKEYFDYNVGGTLNVLRASKVHKVSRCVFTSTAGVNGPSPGQPVTERHYRRMDFFSEYESSKMIAETAVKDYVIDGLDAVIVSPTRVFGPFLEEKTAAATMLIERYLKGFRLLPGDGRLKGNYVYIDDVVNGHILAMEKGRKGHTYLLGGENVSYLDFFRTIMEITRRERRMIPVPYLVQLAWSHIELLRAKAGAEPGLSPKWARRIRHDWEVSTLKAEEELGYSITAFREGMKRTLEWLGNRDKTVKQDLRLCAA